MRGPFSPSTATRIIGEIEGSTREEIVTLGLDRGDISSSAQAINWLLEQGIAARRQQIDRAMEAHKQIEDVRRGLRSVALDEG